MPMKRFTIWDPAVRIFHWSVVAGFAANALIVDDDSDLHLWIGYMLAGLIALRLVWGLIGSRYARFASFPPSLSGAMGQLSDMVSGRRRVHLGHSPLGALMIYNLIAALGVIALSGWMMGLDAFWGAEWVEDLHELCVTWAELSVLVHVGAVIWESRRTRVNLPRAMLTGVKAVPADARIET